MAKVKVFALYRKPDDVEAFMRHYQEVHLPLVRKTPGLERIEVNRVTGEGSGQEPEYFLITEMVYPDQDAFRTAIRSDENRAVMRDAGQLAGDRLTVYISEVME